MRPVRKKLFLLLSELLPPGEVFFLGEPQGFGEPVAGFPHCGAPPVPGALRWKLDQFLIGSLLFLAGAGLAYARPRAVVARDFCEPFRMALAFISPLCHLSVALFSARVAQHMAITLRRSAADRARVPSRRQAHAMARGSWGQCFRLGQHARLRCNLLALARSPSSTTRPCGTISSIG